MTTEERIAQLRKLQAELYRERSEVSDGPAIQQAIIDVGTELRDLEFPSTVPPERRPH
jgi:hypothetical protein